MRRGPWFFKKAIKILVIVAAAILLFGFIVMNLWNAILVPVVHVGVITFGQALGLLVLSKILFGGFHGRWGGGPGRWRNGMKDKWMHMSEEEREKFKKEWGNRCAGWGRPAPPRTDTAE